MTFNLGRIEREHPELKIHLIEDVDHPICGAKIWVVEWKVDWVGGRYSSIDDFLLALRKGESSPPSCMRCCVVLRRFREQNS